MSVVAAAVVGSAALGAYTSNKASKRAKESADKLAESGDAAAQLGRDQFDWYKQEYERTRPEREATAARDAKIADAQYAGMQYALNQAKELDERNKSVFRPLEDRIVSDAANFNTEAKREELAGQAQTDVNAAFAGARGQQIRQLASYGITPGSGKAMALDSQLTRDQALATAGAKTKARRDATAEGYARTMDAVGLGKGIVGSQATMQQISQNGGNASVSAGGAGLAANQSGAGLMAQGFGSAMQGYGAQNGLYGTAGMFQRQAYAQQQQGLTDLGTGVGYALGDQAMKNAILGGKFSIPSDKNIKTHTGKPADTKKALAELDATQVDDGWRYDEAKGAPSGSGGAEHTGPMAQEVRRTMGDRVAPGGKQIDLVSMNGKLMASMQELSKRVKKIERRVAA